uniref:Uncharacterized protein n=1 Tax=Anguilla anguilla TaxID=7936 RepID=A0A0E9TEI6_ANGAN
MWKLNEKYTIINTIVKMKSYRL